MILCGVNGISANDVGAKLQEIWNIAVTVRTIGQRIVIVYIVGLPSSGGSSRVVVLYDLVRI